MWSDSSWLPLARVQASVSPSKTWGQGVLPRQAVVGVTWRNRKCGPQGSDCVRGAEHGPRRRGTWGRDATPGPPDVKAQTRPRGTMCHGVWTSSLTSLGYFYPSAPPDSAWGTDQGPWGPPPNPACSEPWTRFSKVWRGRRDDLLPSHGARTLRPLFFFTRLPPPEKRSPGGPSPREPLLMQLSPQPQPVRPAPRPQLEGARAPGPRGLPRVPPAGRGGAGGGGRQVPCW